MFAISRRSTSVSSGMSAHASRPKTARADPSHDRSKIVKKASKTVWITAWGGSRAPRIVSMFTPAEAQQTFDPRQPFSRAEARAAGLTPEMLLSRRFQKIFWDTYVSRDVAVTPLLRAKAVISLVPSGGVHQPSHRSRTVGCGTASQWSYSRHSAVGQWALGSPRNLFPLPRGSRADHSPERVAYFHS